MKKYDWLGWIKIGLIAQLPVLLLLLVGVNVECAMGLLTVNPDITSVVSLLGSPSLVFTMVLLIILFVVAAAFILAFVGWLKPLKKLLENKILRVFSVLLLASLLGMLVYCSFWEASWVDLLFSVALGTMAVWLVFTKLKWKIPVL